MGHCPKDGLLVDINGIIQDLNHRMTAGRDLAGLVAGGLGATMERVGAMKGTANYSGLFQVGGVDQRIQVPVTNGALLLQQTHQLFVKHTSQQHLQRGVKRVASGGTTLNP